MKYYAVRIKENKEIVTKESILKKIDNLKVHIPVVKSRVKSGNHVCVSYEKSFPDYLIVECSECMGSLKKIASMENVEELLLEDIPLRELKKHLKERELEDSKYEVQVIDGPHSGSIGKIDGTDGDFVVMTLNSKLKIRIPIWHIEQKIAVDDLMR